MEESSEIPDWIETVVTPLDVDPELGIAARTELLALAPKADPEQCRAIKQRLEARAARKNRWGPILYWAPLAFVLVMLGLSIPQYLHFRALQSFVTAMQIDSEDRSLERRLGSKLNAKERRFVFGDPSQPIEELARKALWDDDPQNLALFAEYIAATDPLPSDFLETAQRLDPQNGWFLLIAAGTMAEDAVEKEQGPRLTQEERDDPTRKRTSTFQILDEQELAAAIALVHQAAGKQRLEPYQPELLRQRLRLLPPETDFLSRTFRLVIAASSDSSNIFRVMRASEIISAEAQRLAAAGERKELQRLVGAAEILCRQLAESEGTLIHGLVALAVTIGVHEHLLEACETAGLSEEAERLGPIVTKLRKLRELRRQTPEDDHLLQMHGGALTAMVSSRILSGFGVQTPTMEEMRAGRLMNYALFERLALWVLTIVLLLAIIPLLLLPLFRGRLARQLGWRFSALLGPRDRLWIVGLGTVVPLLWYYGICWLTPLGCRDWSLVHMIFQPAQAQASLLAYLVVAATLYAVRWRLHRHADSLGFGRWRPVLGTIPSIVAALAIPVCGLVRYTDGNYPLIVAGGMGGIVMLWFLFLLVRVLFGNRSRAPSRMTVARLLIPSFCWAACLALALVPLTVAAERHFLAQDTLMKTSPENLGMGRIEAQNTAAIYRALREAL